MPDRPLGLLLALFVGVLPAAGCRPRDEAGHAHFASPQVAPLALASDGLLYIAHTPSDKVQVVDTATSRVLGEIDVGIEPVSLALRPNRRARSRTSCRSACPRSSAAADARLRRRAAA